MDTSHTQPLDSLLIQASENGNLDELKLLISQGANINACNDKNESILALAICKRKFNVAIWLIENGADLSVVSTLGITILDYIYIADCPQMFQYVLRYMRPNSKPMINEKIGHMFYYVVTNGLVEVVDFVVKHSQDWRSIHIDGTKVLSSAIYHFEAGEKTDGIYRLLSEMTKKERQKALDEVHTPYLGCFILKFEQALEHCGNNVSSLTIVGSHHLAVLKQLFPKDLAALIANKWLNICLSGEQKIPDWYHHCIEKDFAAKYKSKDIMDIEETDKQPVLLFSQESQPAIRKNNTKKKKQDESMDVDNDTVAKHSGCFAFGKPKPCSIQ